MEKPPRPWERASQQAAWYDDQPFNIGDRVQIIDPVEQDSAGASAGRVVGYDASGPRPGERFIRVLVMPDRAPATIVAIPPVALQPEAADSERLGIAKTLLTGLEQNLPSDQFAKLLAWFAGDKCRALLADPNLSGKNIRLGNLTIPGMIVPELFHLAVQRLQVEH